MILVNSAHMRRTFALTYLLNRERGRIKIYDVIVL